MKIFLSYIEKPENVIGIHLTDFKFGLNEDGFFVLDFKSDSHKYLNVIYHGSTNQRFSEDGKPFWAEMIKIVDFNAPNYYECFLVFQIEPETEEESLSLGDFSVQRMGWQTRVLFIKSDKFIIKKEEQILDFDNQVKEIFEENDQ